ncbi:hypothetical protein [Nocardia rhamnosiphila]|uniref:Uncharacterized protein n=1 Tax=Nocardia rhamnosiphila TaxID=426716 RepID=A0ABV2WT09_9NOCA
MKLIVLAADSAQMSADGKLHALGLGTIAYPTPTPPMSLIVMVEFEASDTAREGVSLVGELRSQQSGEQLTLGDDGETVGFDEALDGIKGRGRGRATALFNFNGGMPVEPGGYYWHVRIRGTDLVEEVPVRFLEQSHDQEESTGEQDA